MTEPKDITQGAPKPAELPKRPDAAEDVAAAQQALEASGVDLSGLEDQAELPDEMGERPEDSERVSAKEVQVNRRRERFTPEQLAERKKQYRKVREEYEKHVGAAAHALSDERPTILERQASADETEVVEVAVPDPSVTFDELSLAEQVKEIGATELSRARLGVNTEEVQALMKFVLDAPKEAKQRLRDAKAAFEAAIQDAGVPNEILQKAVFTTTDENGKKIKERVLDRMNDVRRRSIEKVTAEALRVSLDFVRSQMRGMTQRLNTATRTSWEPYGAGGINQFRPTNLDKKMERVDELAGVDANFATIEAYYNQLAELVNAQFPPKRHVKKGDERRNLLLALNTMDKQLHGELQVYSEPFEQNTTPTQAEGDGTEGEQQAVGSGRLLRLGTDQDIMRVPGIYKLLEAAHALDGTKAPKEGSVLNVLKERPYLRKLVESARRQADGNDQDVLVANLPEGVPNIFRSRQSSLERQRQRIQRLSEPVAVHAGLIVPDRASLVELGVMKFAKEQGTDGNMYDTYYWANPIEEKRYRIRTEISTTVAVLLESAIAQRAQRSEPFTLQQIDNIYWSVLTRSMDVDGVDLGASKSDDANAFDRQDKEKRSDWQARRTELIKERAANIRKALGLTNEAGNIDTAKAGNFVAEVMNDAKAIGDYRFALEGIRKKLGKSVGLSATRELQRALASVETEEQATLSEELSKAIDAQIGALEKHDAELKELHGVAGGKTRNIGEKILSIKSAAENEEEARKAIGEFFNTRYAIIADRLGLSGDRNAVQAKMQSLLDRIKAGATGKDVFATTEVVNEEVEAAQAEAESNEALRRMLGERLDAIEDDESDEAEEVDAAPAVEVEVDAENADGASVEEGVESEDAADDVVEVALTQEEQEKQEFAEVFKESGKYLTEEEYQATWSIFQEVWDNETTGTEIGLDEKLKTLQYFIQEVKRIHTVFQKVLEEQQLSVFDVLGLREEGSKEIDDDKLFAYITGSLYQLDKHLENYDVLPSEITDEIVRETFKGSADVFEKLTASTEGNFAISMVDLKELFNGMLRAAGELDADKVFDPVATFQQIVKKLSAQSQGGLQGVDLLVKAKLMKKVGDSYMMRQDKVTTVIKSNAQYV